MNKPRRIFLLALTAAIAAGCASYDNSHPEPSYQGKLLNEWLETVRRPTAEGEKADKAVRFMGKKAIPTLLLMLQDKYTPAKTNSMALADEQSLARTNILAAGKYPYQGLDGLRILGYEAREALPELVRLFHEHDHDPLMIYFLPHAMAVVSPEAIPILRRGLTNQDWTIRFACVSALRLAGTNAWAAVPDLLQRLEDSSPTVRIYTVRLLGGLRRDPATVLPALLKSAQEDSDAMMRSQCIESMGAYRTLAAAFAPALRKILDSTNASDIRLRGPVWEALKHIDPSFPPPPDALWMRGGRKSNPP